MKINNVTCPKCGWEGNLDIPEFAVESGCTVKTCYNCGSVVKFIIDDGGIKDKKIT